MSKGETDNGYTGLVVVLNERWRVVARCTAFQSATHAPGTAAGLAVK